MSFHLSGLLWFSRRFLMVIPNFILCLPYLGLRAIFKLINYSSCFKRIHMGPAGDFWFDMLFALILSFCPCFQLYGRCGLFLIWHVVRPAFDVSPCRLFSSFLNCNLYCLAFVLCIVWTLIFCSQRLRAASSFCFLYLLLDLTALTAHTKWFLAWVNWCFFLVIVLRKVPSGTPIFSLGLARMITLVLVLQYSVDNSSIWQSSVRCRPLVRYPATAINYHSLKLSNSE